MFVQDMRTCSGDAPGGLDAAGELVMAPCKVPVKNLRIVKFYTHLYQICLWSKCVTYWTEKLKVSRACKMRGPSDSAEVQLDAAGVLVMAPR